MKKNFTVLLVIFLLIITANFAIDIHVPAMPVIVKQLHISVTSVQLTMGVFFLAYGLFPMLFGTLSDGYGRRTVVIVSLCILLLGSVICLIAKSTATLLCGRFVQGIGAGGCAPLSSIIMRDRYDAADLARIASLMGVAIELTLALSPAIGGYLVNYFGWRSNFIFVVTLTLMVLVFIFFMFKETARHHHKSNMRIKNIIKNSREILLHREFNRYIWPATAAYCSGMVFFTISPFVIQMQLHYSAKIYGLMTLYVTGAIVLGSWINAFLVQRIGHVRLVYTGLVLMLLSGIGLMIITLLMPITLGNFILLSALTFLGLAFLFGNCISGAFTPFEKQAGIVGSLYRTIQVLVTFVVVFIVSVSAYDNTYFLSLIYILTSGAALGVFYQLRERKMNSVL